MDIKGKLFHVYKLFYAQRSVLNGAPPLTIPADQIGTDDFDDARADAELQMLVAYLIGVRDLSQISIRQGIKIVTDAYSSQPQWKELLLDYFDYALSKEEEALKQQGEALKDETASVLLEIQRHEEIENETIEAYADKLEAQHFPIDARKLIRNYLKMRRQDSQKAWEVLIQNPAYFSPIIVEDKNGQSVMTPQEAIAKNKEIGKFLKNLSV